MYSLHQNSTLPSVQQLIVSIVTLLLTLQSTVGLRSRVIDRLTGKSQQILRDVVFLTIFRPCLAFRGLLLPVPIGSFFTWSMRLRSLPRTVSTVTICGYYWDYCSVRANTAQAAGSLRLADCRQVDIDTVPKLGMLNSVFPQPKLDCSKPNINLELNHSGRCASRKKYKKCSAKS